MIKLKQIDKPQQILVVDDQEINRDILGAILEDRYDVLYAVDGVEALRLIETHIESLSLVILDLFMPRMDGFEVLKRLTENPRTKSYPLLCSPPTKAPSYRRCSWVLWTLLPNRLNCPK